MALKKLENLFMKQMELYWALRILQYIFTLFNAFTLYLVKIKIIGIKCTFSGIKRRFQKKV